MQGQQAEAMTVVVKGDQATFEQLLPVFFKNFHERLTDDLRNRTLHAELNHAGQTCSPQCENAREVQVLGDNNGMLVAGVIEDRVIRVAYFAYIPPVSGGDAVMSEEILPTRRKVLVNDQVHDASS